MARALVREAGGQVAKVIVKRGKANLDPLIKNYNRAATRAPYLVLRDSDTKCPMELHKTLTRDIESLSALFQLRVVHPMTEAWLLADADGFAQYFGVVKSNIPSDPEALKHPKATLLSLCSSSKKKDIREEVVRNDGKAGPLYVDHVNEFALLHWNVSAASSRSDSLLRAYNRVRELNARALGD
ncbi:hypothetical protein ABID74_003323 [Gordonia terrae]